MYQPTLRRKPLPIDMTAMCDIAFLILTFFILTAQPRMFGPLIENPAASSNVLTEWNRDVVGVIISNDKVMFQLPDNELRPQILSVMADKYDIKFTPAEIKKFEKVDIIGSSMAGLKQFINDYPRKTEYNLQPGIKIDPNGNELANWIHSTQEVYQALRDNQPGFIINADKSTGYPMIKKVTDILQSQQINKFSLLTSLKLKK